MNRFLHFLIPAFFFLNTLVVLGHNFVPDSLRNVSVEEKILFLNRKGHNHNNLDSSKIFFNEALKLSKTCDCDSLSIITHINTAYHFIFNKGKIELGLKEIQGFEHLISQSKNPYFKYRVALMKGYSHALKDQSESSFQHYNEALTYAAEMNDSFRMGIVYNNLGNNFNSYDDSKAKAYYKKAIDLYERHDAPNSEKQITYLNMAKVSGAFDSIKYYSEKSYLYLDTTNETSLVHFYLNKSSAFFSKGFFKEGRLAAEKAYKHAVNSNYEIARDQALLALGYTELELGNTNQAIKYLEEAKQSKVIGLLNKKYTYASLVEAYKKNNQLDLALQTSQELLALTDSVYEQRKSSTFAEFDAKFNLAEKDKEIAQQELEIANQKNTRNLWIFSSICILLLGSGGAIWLNNRQKRKKAFMQMQLQKQQEINDFRTKFLGNIAHEIRTPLTMVAGNLQLALEGIDNKTKAIQYIEKAIKNADTITDDTNQILELLKLEKQKITLNKTVFPLKTTLERIVYSFQSTAEVKNIQLIYNSTLSDPINIITDLGKLEKIINNLLSNAIKYSPSHTVVKVNDAMVANELKVSVTDQGKGIDYKEQSKIFERFYQSEENAQAGGIGIGLALSKEFSQILGGSLQVESRTGQGSTFIFKLPLEIAETQKAIVEDNPSEKEVVKESSDKRPNPAHRILIVEDNPQMAAYLQEILLPYYECAIAFNGEEALNKLREEQFDLITSDIMMPSIDGFEFRKRVNQFPQHAFTPFIFISAKTLTEDIIKGFSLGVADYVTKPFNKNELVARIKNLLINKQERQQWQLENAGQHDESESANKKLLKKVEEYVVENIDDDDFKINELASHVGYSQRQLARLMKQYTGMTPVKFILEIRLQKAYALLKSKSYTTLSEVRYAVGINSSAYLNKKFEERFGVTPAEMM